uniref:Macro domain-containing protein n=1 Tax=Xiphophorus maculatus TaxID=8083 RepID=A0A3B5R1L7_XIPMA
MKAKIVFCFCNNKKTQSTNWTLNYVTGDLFSCPGDESLALCISEDCGMGAGIAAMFKKKFGRVSELKEQKKLPGQCAVLTYDQRFSYHLSQKKASQKPTCQPKKELLIGCDLDQLQWSKVSKILEQIFKETNISITVCSLPCVALKLHMHAM